MQPAGAAQCQHVATTRHQHLAKFHRQAPVGQDLCRDIGRRPFTKNAGARFLAFSLVLMVVTRVWSNAIMSCNICIGFGVVVINWRGRFA